MNALRVIIFVQGNIARGKPTFQASTGYSGVSSRAVDGNKDTHYGGGSCTHTKIEVNPWWAVDLQWSGVHVVGQVNITNRGDKISK